MMYNKVNERLTQTICFSSTEWRAEKLSVLEMKCFVIIMANMMDGNTMVSCSRATDGQPGTHKESQPT